MGHLLPVELFFYLVAHSGIDNLEYINYMYMVAVAMHGIFWFSKKLQPYVDALDMIVSHKSDLEKLFGIFKKPSPQQVILNYEALLKDASEFEKDFLERLNKVKVQK